MILLHLKLVLERVVQLEIVKAAIDALVMTSKAVLVFDEQVEFERDYDRKLIGNHFFATVEAKFGYDRFDEAVYFFFGHIVELRRQNETIGR